MLRDNHRVQLLKLLNSPLVQSIIYSRFLDYHQWSLLTFIKRQSSNIESNKSILDAGAGELRYKKYFKHCKYTSNDLCLGDDEWYFEDIDIKSSLYDIPRKDNSFDNILCSQVLEHLEFPELAFKEFSRLLKKGGKLIVTVPLGQGEHQVPHDYYRYTKYALASLGERNGLKIDYIQPQGGIFINLEYILWQSLYCFIPFTNLPFIRYVAYVFLLPLKLLSGVLFNFLDLFDRKKTYTNNYNCTFVKI